jgi:transposase
MRPFGTALQLARRRKRALRLLRQGQSPHQVAQKVGTTARSVRRWQQAVHTAQPKPSARTPGRPARLSEGQRERLKQSLRAGALAQGYAEEYWTLARIAALIWDLFQVRYDPSGVWHLLQRMDWSCQQPQRRAFGRDEQAIRRWRRSTWYRIKKVAARAGNPRFSR